MRYFNEYVGLREVGIVLGYALAFIGSFLPWYTVNIYGNTTVYSAMFLATQFSNFWILYIIPMISGMGLVGSLIYFSNKSKKLPKYSKIISIVLSVIILIVTSIAIVMYPASLKTPLADSLSVGGYAVITGATLSLIFSLIRI